MVREEEKPSTATGINKNTKTREQLEQEILEFLNDASTKPGTSTKPGCQLKHGLACVLATAHDNIPRATPVDFFADGLILWIAGEPGLKIRNIRSNPKVAVGIYHPMDHSKHNRSLQIQGTATLLNVITHKEEVMSRAMRFGIYQAVEKKLRERNPDSKTIDTEIMDVMRRFNFIRIEPEEIIFLSFHPTAGTTKDVWKKEV